MENSKLQNGERRGIQDVAFEQRVEEASYVTGKRCEQSRTELDVFDTWLKWSEPQGEW